MRRREFITVLGGTAAWPLVSRAQQSGKPVRVGVFAGARNPVIGSAYRAFLDELSRAGFIEGQNLTVEQQPADQELPALSEQAVAMVRANSDVLVALGSEPVLQACVAATRTIPIIFVANNYDPIARGYVQSLAKPGGNVTGVFLRQTELAEKQVELLTHAFADRRRLAVMWDYISADRSRRRSDAQIRQGATFVGKILKGAKPTELPVELPTKFEMVVNLRTAKAIGIELPTGILLRADEVIE